MSEKDQNVKSGDKEVCVSEGDENENVNKLAEDREFIEKILSLQTKEEVQTAFAERGVNLSMEEVETFIKLVKEGAANGGKIPDELVESVSGGGIVKGVSDLAGAVKNVAYACVAVMAACMTYKLCKDVNERGFSALFDYYLGRRS